MLSAELVAYLHDGINRKTPWETVEGLMVTQKYSPAMIDEAKQWYKEQTTPVPEPPAQQESVAFHSDQAEQVAVGTPTLSQKRWSYFSSKKYIALISVLVLFVVFSTSMLLIAYGKLPIGSPSFQTAVSDIVLSIPFLPKTPDYVIRSAMRSHKDLKRFTIDASIAMTIKSLGPVMGSDLDFAIKGPVDYTDPQNPQMSLNVGVTKEFNMDLRLKEKATYFKLNQLPSFLSLYLAFFGVTDDTIGKLEHKWFVVKDSGLDTEARRNLNSQEDTRPVTNRIVTGVLTSLADSRVRKHLSMTDDHVDSFDTYKIHITADKQVVDIIDNNISQEFDNNTSEKDNPEAHPSQYINGFTMDSWIDKKTHYVRKVAVTFTIKQQKQNAALIPPGSGSMTPMPEFNEPIPVSAVMHISNFDEPVTIETPENPQNFEDVLKDLIMNNATGSGGLNPAKQFSQANNTKRRSDVNAILNGIDQYAADHKGALPFGIPTVSREISSTGSNICSSLITEYLAALPVDPLINDGTPITNCSSTYSTGYTVVRSTVDGRVTVSAPKAELGEVISVTR